MTDQDRTKNFFAKADQDYTKNQPAKPINELWNERLALCAKEETLVVSDLQQFILNSCFYMVKTVTLNQSSFTFYLPKKYKKYLAILQNTIFPKIQTEHKIFFSLKTDLKSGYQCECDDECDTCKIYVKVDLQ